MKTPIEHLYEVEQLLGAYDMIGEDDNVCDAFADVFEALRLAIDKINKPDEPIDCEEGYDGV